jgi:hypothetical protein
MIPSEGHAAAGQQAARRSCSWRGRRQCIQQLPQQPASCLRSARRLWCAAAAAPPALLLVGVTHPAACACWSPPAVTLGRRSRPWPRRDSKWQCMHGDTTPLAEQEDAARRAAQRRAAGPKPAREVSHPQATNVTGECAAQHFLVFLQSRGLTSIFFKVKPPAGRCVRVCRATGAGRARGGLG